MKVFRRYKVCNTLAYRSPVYSDIHKYVIYLRLKRAHKLYTGIVVFLSSCNLKHSQTAQLIFQNKYNSKIYGIPKQSLGK